MNQYQKVYMNQIHSSSLLGQLAQMWRSQMLCDALIRTGNVTTKAHRVVLVAACPMLQSMDNASVGSHLEVRLAADIKQDAVNSFLQYLYEGFMMLTEENCKDVEKVARLLQVDSVTKCCIDFYNCLQKKTGVPVYSNTQYKYSSADLLEFRHVRTTDLQKTIQERIMKRAAADSMRPMSPGGKRQRTQQQQQQRPLSPNIDLAMFGQKADDTLSMAHSYMGNTGNQASDPWERVPRIGTAQNQKVQPRPGVIEIVEDSLEILQTQPPDKDGNKSAPPVVQKSLSISVSSQINPSTDVHIVNVNDTSSHPTAATDGPIMSTGRDSITVSPLTVMPGSSSSTSSPLTKDQHKPSYDNQKEMSDRVQFAKKSQSLEQQSSTPQRGLFPVTLSPANMSPISQVSQQKKSFAAGSASQAASMSQTQDSPAITMNKRSSSSAGNEMVDRPPSSDSGKELGAKSKIDDGSSSNSTDMAPDLSIVKVEPTIDDPGLDMYVDVPDESMIQAQHRDHREHDDESDLELEEASGDWSRDEMSNEAGGNDQNNSWYIGQFKDVQPVNKPDEYSVPKSPKQILYDLENQQPDSKAEIIAAWYTIAEESSSENIVGERTVVEGVKLDNINCPSTQAIYVAKTPEYDVADSSTRNVEILAYRNDSTSTNIDTLQNIPSSKSDDILTMDNKQMVTHCGNKSVDNLTDVNDSTSTITDIETNVPRSKPIDFLLCDEQNVNKVVEHPLKIQVITSKYAKRKASIVGRRSIPQRTVSSRETNLIKDSNTKTSTKVPSSKSSVNQSANKKGVSTAKKIAPSVTVPKPGLVDKTTTRKGVKMKAERVQPNRPSTYKRRKRMGGHKRIKVEDPQFWSIALQHFTGYQKELAKFGSINVSKHLSCVPPGAESIAGDIVEEAMSSCDSSREKFTISLVRSVFSVGDVVRRTVEEKGGKKRLLLKRATFNNLKLKLVQELTFNYFPAESKQGEENIWKTIIKHLNSIRRRAHLRVEKLFDVTAIMDK